MLELERGCKKQARCLKCDLQRTYETLAKLWYLGKAMEARLQTADSSGLVYSMISVQRLLHLMVPRFC